MEIKYCYKEGCHVFIDDIYAGFQASGDELKPNYSSMTSDWVASRKTEADLMPFLEHAGFKKARNESGKYLVG